MTNFQEYLDINYPKSQRKTIEKLDLSNKNLEGSLGFITDFTNLKELNISGNPLVGSLESLKNLTKLKHLNFNDTDIDSGLEYLPESLEEIHCFPEKNPSAKVKTISTIVDLLFKAVERNKVDEIKEIIVANKLKNLNFYDKLGDTLLHHAVQKNYQHQETVKYLLELGAFVDCQNEKYKETPLHMAVENNNLWIAMELLLGGANPNIQSNMAFNVSYFEDDDWKECSYKCTAMDYAARQNNFEMLELLIKCGGDVDKYILSIIRSAAWGAFEEKNWEPNWAILKLLWNKLERKLERKEMTEGELDELVSSVENILYDRDDCNQRGLNHKFSDFQIEFEANKELRKEIEKMIKNKKENDLEQIQENFVYALQSQAHSCKEKIEKLEQQLNEARQKITELEKETKNQAQILQPQTFPTFGSKK